MGGLPPSILGLSVAGDIGEQTFFTTRTGKIVSYKKSPPDCEPTLAQQIQRYRFRAAMATWRAASDSVKYNYQYTCEHTGIRMLGQNLWVYMAFHQDWNLLLTLEGQAGVDLVMPPNVNDL